MKRYPKAELVLEDGSIYRGFSFGHDSSTAGEVVFSTGMVGYPKSLTDPSYSGQILVFTYPLIGNYGIAPKQHDIYKIPKSFESFRIHVKGVIVSEFSQDHNHWNSQSSFQGWLVENKIPAIAGIDTRALTIKIREKGVMLGKIVIGKDTDFYDPNIENQVRNVSRNDTLTLGKGKHRIVVLDCGIKNNILRCLLRRDVTITIVPWDYDFNKLDYDGLFISNGPGDPTHCKESINNIKKAMEKNKSIFGICLGNQLLALAAGARTYKLKYGHRSQNQPCVIAGEKTGFITSQNHGYAVDTKTLPKGWEEFFYNANDHTNEGIRHRTLPFFSVQFHPEGSCGPMDTEYLFDEFVEMIEKNKAANKKTKER
jgi:carbamoyl-phosphate synthase small subunit